MENKLINDKIKELKKRLQMLKQGECERRFYIKEEESCVYQDNPNAWKDNIQEIEVNKEKPWEHFFTSTLLYVLESEFEVTYDDEEETVEEWIKSNEDCIVEKYHLSEQPVEYYEELAQEAYKEWSEEEDNIIDRWWLGDEDRHNPITWEELDNEEQEEWIKKTVVDWYQRKQKNWNIKW